MKKLSLFLFFNLLVQLTFAQYQIGIVPRTSPDKTVSQKIGYTEVKIQYGSPSVKNRTIWGELVPYAKVWRAGANNATTIEFSSSVTISGQSLEKGKYAFFILPKENDKWTVIFNKVSKQWGAFKYNQKEDALRCQVNPRITKHKTEKLTYDIHSIGFKHGSITLAWDFMEIEVAFETNYLAELKQKVENIANQPPDFIRWIPYVQGAEHLHQIGDRINLAKKWLNEAEKIMNTTKQWNDQFYPRPYVEAHLYWTKAKILAWDNNYKEAIEYVDKLKGLKNTIFYDRKNEKEGIDGYYETWKNR